MDGEIFRRKAYDELLTWKNDSLGSTSVLIDGARRVGKTYLAKMFAESNYRSYILIDFSKNDPTVKDMFTNGLSDLDFFFQRLMALDGTVLYDRESVIILDEVQRFPRAREALKFLVEDGRYDYIETGSLISIKNNVDDIVVPSEEDVIYLHPLDFEEFLWALGNEASMPLVRRCFDELVPLGPAVHRRMMDLFRKYILVGGMPQAVKAYIGSGSFEEAEKAKKRILNLYRNDIAKFAGKNKAKVKRIFDSIPSELTRGDKEFRITSLGKNARSRDYEDAFMWLDDGRIINQCYNSTEPDIGLSMNTEMSRHKCYMGDTGLLVTLALADSRAIGSGIYDDILNRDIGINEGMFMENVVSQQLVSAGHNLFYYAHYDTEMKRCDMEVDFLIERGKRISPIEVKSGRSIAHRSLERFTKTFADELGTSFILCNRDVEVRKDCIVLPVYMALLLRDRGRRSVSPEPYRLEVLRGLGLDPVLLVYGGREIGALPVVPVANDDPVRL